MMFPIATYIVLRGWTKLPPWSAAACCSCYGSGEIPQHRLSVSPSACTDHTPESLQKTLLPVKKGEKNLSRKPQFLAGVVLNATLTFPPKPHSWARLPKELHSPSQSHRVLTRFQHASYAVTLSWGCVCALQTQGSAYTAGSSSWKVWTLRCKSSGARSTSCSGENSPFKSRHADYVSSFLISWRVKVPSANMRALCSLRA